MQYSIEHLLHINASINEVYEAISIENPRQWYTTNVKENPDMTKNIQMGRNVFTNKMY